MQQTARLLRVPFVARPGACCYRATPPSPRAWADCNDAPDASNRARRRLRAGANSGSRRNGNAAKLVAMAPPRVRRLAARPPRLRRGTAATSRARPRAWLVGTGDLRAVRDRLRVRRGRLARDVHART